MHVAVIPDGNRRYMEKASYDLRRAYDEGIRHLIDFVGWCSELGVKEVTVYTLSLENLDNRGKEELKILFDLLLNKTRTMLKSNDFNRLGIRVNVCGDMSRLPPGLSGELLKLEESTKKNKKIKLNLAIAYGGRQELLQAVQKIITAKAEPTEANIHKHLWIKSEPDIIIRTSEFRLSNFLPWQSTYSEIYFISKLWQEFSRPDLEGVLNYYKMTEKRRGA